MTPTGEGPACTLGVCDPLPPLPAGSGMVVGAPREMAPFALKSAQDGSKTTSRREEDDKMKTRRYQDVFKGFKRALRGLKIAT